MTALIEQLAFDYALLDSETRIVVQQRTTEIRGLMRRAAQDIIEIGQKLIEVKVRLGHGRFGSWLEAEFEWSTDTAGNFMRVAHRFGEFPKISEIAPSALYLLAAPSTPEPARIEAIERAERGEALTYSQAKEIVAAHKAELPPTTTSRPAAPLAEDDEPLTDYEEQILAAQRPAEPPKPSPMAVHFSSNSVEWYTPRHIIDRVLAQFGHIDLDPCSNAHGERANVPARVHFTKDDDGLVQSWRVAPWIDDYGDESRAVRVFVNPPYGRDGLPAWVDRVLRAYETGEATEIILLVPGRPGSEWWKRLRHYPVCFPYGRVMFEGADVGAPFPSAIFYFGHDIAAFRDTFGTEDFGEVREVV